MSISIGAGYELPEEQKKPAGGGRGRGAGRSAVEEDLNDKLQARALAAVDGGRASDNLSKMSNSFLSAGCFWCLGCGNDRGPLSHYRARHCVRCGGV